MRLLLDTHIAVWSLVQDRRLTREALDLIADGDNAIYVSLVSVWEIAIKRGTTTRPKNDPMPVSAEQAGDLFQQAGFELLPLKLQHTIAVERLPPLHRDPFDRMLAAQALCEPMHLVTADARVAAYSPSFIRV